ncbi:Cys-tRNA(Pro) deacylase [Natronincola ferrireducens]|uniref:Cys-tRNA(Pro)/Cys-tRNA(Cys) deacylase n=1 Tax=Natronincola ferrireducens TaxID=393762 RepID=A0A1G9A038_9FIRM|nr:Cys-tRNA(Pro) deacylase [Natronincola ferrireducens]SDK20567.1 Cys-tRNA(Pro)/Cys-tRNA(Cys) deacylase [Natronincola ferrireducens]
MKKTNAARVLDKLKIFYDIREYEVEETDLSAENAAEKVGFPLEQVFKTLVAKGDKTGVIICCISGERELNLKKIAALSKNKKVDLVPLKEVQQLTGYIRGGVSPIAMKKSYPTYIDERAIEFSMIMISAGLRGCQLLLHPQDLAKAVKGTFGDITN